MLYAADLVVTEKLFQADASAVADLQATRRNHYGSDSNFKGLRGYTASSVT